MRHVSNCFYMSGSRLGCLGPTMNRDHGTKFSASIWVKSHTTNATSRPLEASRQTRSKVSLKFNVVQNNAVGLLVFNIIIRITVCLFPAQRRAKIEANAAFIFLYLISFNEHEHYFVLLCCI